VSSTSTSTSTAQAEYEYDNAVIPDFGQHLVVVIGEKRRRSRNCFSCLSKDCVGVGLSLGLSLDLDLDLNPNLNY
jgi:hypothetical protein